MEKHKARFDQFAQTKFCCYFELKKGCTIIGVVMTIGMAVCIIASVIQTVGLQYCEGCAYNSWRFAYAQTISACIYCCLMFLFNLWFIWGVRKEKKSVVMAWVVLSAVLLAQASCLLIVLVMERSSDGGIVVWVFNLIFTICVILLLSYFPLVGYGYWLQLRDEGAASRAAAPPQIN